MYSHQIHRILTIILAACFVICLRTLYLGVVQREEKLVEAQRPQLRTLLQRAHRGTICDRFGIPLALNKICYNATIYYNQIAQIPQVQWKEETNGKRVRTTPRKTYIESLAKMLGKVLKEPSDRIEDLIYSKASLFPHAPYVIKSRLTEEEHYRLKGLERNWPGLHAEIAAERCYPFQKTACHILGTMGAIHPKKYAEIASELSLLQEAVETYEQGLVSALPRGYDSFEKVCERLEELREKAYTLNDSVGKSGIEGEFEEQLRGFCGKKIFEVDQKGRFVREAVGGKEPITGRQITLSISSELQQFAEELLAIAEKDREGRIFGVDSTDKKRKLIKQPWVKGGAIVAIDPNNGEILAMASLPRFDPNDFVGQPRLKMQLCRWLENERYVKAVWDGQAPLVKEQFSRRFFEEETQLTWDLYLDLILPKESPLRLFFHQHDDIKTAIQLQEDFETVRYFSGFSDPLKIMEDLFAPLPKFKFDATAGKALRRLELLLGGIASHADKLLAIDLCRLCIDSSRFSDELISKVGSMKLSAYQELAHTFFLFETHAKQVEAARFHCQEFALWREGCQKSFLAEKRNQEKEKKTYVRPYLDYLDQKEGEMFTEHWNAKRLSILHDQIKENSKLASVVENFSEDCSIEFLRTFRSFDQLERPLLGQYRKCCSEKDLAAALYPKGGFGYLRSYAFQTSAPQGSLFKLVTAYEGLRQGHHLTIIDDASRDRNIVASALNGTPYPRMYKGGRLPRSSIKQIGKIDVAGALEQTSNPFFSILAGDYLSDPDDLKVAAAQLGYGEKSGLQLPGEVAGSLPDDLRTNRTSLYSFAFGQHTLLSTPIQTSLMLSALANGGNLLKPKIAMKFSGFTPDRKILSAFDGEHCFAERELRALGIPFSLFTGVQAREPVEEIDFFPTQIRRTIPYSSLIRSQLFDGMDRVMWSSKGTARPNIIRSLRLNSELSISHLSLEHQIIGKTSTAEIMHRPNINPSSQAQMIKHIWFGSISFSPDYPAKSRYEHPELVVVVFLRYGDAGREAAPIATQMVKKWREIKKKHATNETLKEFYGGGGGRSTGRG